MTIRKQRTVIEVARRGRDEGPTPLDYAQMRSGVARVDPGGAGTIGATLKQGPSGPYWTKDAVSADWFSDINDAVIAAGPGGTVVLSADTTYNNPEAVRLSTGVSIIGQDRYTSILKSPDTASVIRIANTSIETTHVQLKGFTVDGNYTAHTGIDFRTISHSNIDEMEVKKTGKHGIRFGGEGTVGGWTNTLWRSRIRPDATGGPWTGVDAASAVRIDGPVQPDLPPNGNQISIMGCILYTAGGPYSNCYALDIEKGDSNYFASNDMGYGNATAIRLGPNARYNRSIANRMEKVNGALLIEGGSYNIFLGDDMGLRAGSTVNAIRINAPAQFNVIEPSRLSAQGPLPYVLEQAASCQTTYRLPATRDVYGLAQRINQAANEAFGVYRYNENHPRFGLSADGGMTWGGGGEETIVGLRRVGTHLRLFPGNLEFAGGGYNTPHIVMGSYHIFVDSTGKLRIKNGAPTHNTDGTVVGSQT